MSSSRDRILAAIRHHKPAEQPLPTLPTVGAEPDEPINRFVSTLVAIGADVADLADLPDPLAHVQAVYPTAERRYVSPALSNILGPVAEEPAGPPLSYANVDVALLAGQLAVAENGAVWIDERQLPARVLPFITQHLVLFVRKADIVPDMHAAYARITDPAGFGVFVAGPSKTADIEQSLVKGAQGARTTLVVLV